jgi:hypothetical protein
MAETGIGKLQWFQTGLESGIYVLCSGKENAKCILLKVSGTVNWREEVSCIEW